MKHKSLLAVLCIVMLVMAGCASGPWTAERVTKETAIESDDFTKASFVTSPKVWFAAAEDDGFAFQNFELCKATNRQGEVFYTVNLHTMRGFKIGWAFWRRAEAQGGKEFEVVLGKSDASGGVCTESVSAIVSREYLDSITNGARWRFHGENEAMVEINIPGYLVQGFLKRCDAEAAK